MTNQTKPLTPDLVSAAEREERQRSADMRGGEIVIELTFTRTDGTTCKLKISRDHQLWCDEVVRRRLDRKNYQLGCVIERLEKLSLSTAEALE